MNHLNEVRTNPWNSFRGFLFYFMLISTIGGMMFNWQPVSLLILAYPSESFVFFLVWASLLAFILPPEDSASE